MQFFGGLKLSILSFLGTSGEIEAFYDKTENKVLSSNPPDERLAVTLRYLATVRSYEPLMYQFRIHKITI